MGYKKYLDYGVTLLHNPNILNDKKYIFFLSHMRANTSLFGHLIGSHESINGYYEMQLSYKNCIDLLLQKLKYAKNHSIKSNSDFMFDKLLHAVYSIDYEFLKDKSKFFISIRHPKFTIPSIVKMAERDGSHYSTYKLAQEYYLKRLSNLAEYSREMEGNFFYFDSDAIKTNTTFLLSKVQEYLELKDAISEEYTSQKLTGVGGAGDISKNISTGKIVRASSPNSDYEVPTEILEIYLKSRDEFINKSKISVLE